MTEETTPVVMDSGSTAELAVMERAQIDQLISTAKAYPRNISKCKDDAIALATMDAETAGECFYVLKRGGKEISGPSIRCAEIVAYSWTNLRYGSRVLDADAKHVSGQAFCHDTEKNVFCAIETKRRITNRSGQRYNDDMITTTGNAAAAVSRRQAVFGTIPKSIVKAVYDAARKVAIGDASTVSQRWQDAVTAFSKFGVTEEQLLKYIGKDDPEEITPKSLVSLVGLINAIKDGETTVDIEFNEKGAAKAPKVATGKPMTKPGPKPKVTTKSKEALSEEPPPATGDGEGSPESESLMDELGIE